MIKTIPDSTNAIGDCALRMTVTTGLIPHRNHFVASTDMEALVFILHLLDGGAGRVVEFFCIEIENIISASRGLLRCVRLRGCLRFSRRNDNNLRRGEGISIGISRYT